MTKKTETPSFWTTPASQVPLDDLARIQEYLKPRNPDSLPGFFPRPPLPPSTERLEVEGPRQRSTPQGSPDAELLGELLEEYGITPEAFARSAIDEPELWEDDELERLHAVLSGDLPITAISDIVFEHVRGGGAKPQRAKPPQARAVPPQEEDLEDWVEERLEPPVSGMPQPGLDLSTPPGTIDVGNWWERKSRS